MKFGLFAGKFLVLSILAISPNIFSKDHYFVCNSTNTPLLLTSATTDGSVRSRLICNVPPNSGSGLQSFNPQSVGIQELTQALNTLNQIDINLFSKILGGCLILFIVGYSAGLSVRQISRT